MTQDIGDGGDPAGDAATGPPDANAADTPPSPPVDGLARSLETESKFQTEKRNREEAERKARAFEQRMAELEQQMTVRGEWATMIATNFQLTTIATLSAVGLLGLVDVLMILGETANYQRFVTGQVLLALIGATIAQLGVLAVTVGNWSFGQKSASADTKDSTSEAEETKKEDPA